MNPAELSREIQDTHHALLRAELPRLDAALRAGHAPERLMRPWRELKGLLEGHLDKEEQILFPAITSLVAGRSPSGCALDGPIAQMRADHRRIEALMAELTEAAPDAGSERAALGAMLDDLHAHASKEDNELFPAAMRLPGAAHPVLAGLDKALAWHVRFKAFLDSMAVDLAGWELTPRFSAPWKHFSEGMRDHLRVEEEILFPAIAALAELREPVSTEFEAPLAEMQFELDELRTIADALRNASGEARHREGELLQILDELEAHAEKEESIIFPAANALLERWNRMKADEAQAAVRAAQPADAATQQGAPHAAPQQKHVHVHHHVATPSHPPPEQDETARPSILFRVLRRFAATVVGRR